MKTTNLTMPREDVYDAIDSERAYQEQLVRNTATEQTPLEQIALIETIIARAKADWYDKPGPFDMNYFRKIAGIAVRCMEQYGAPWR